MKAKPALRGPLNFLRYEVADLNGLKRGQCLYESPPTKKSPAAKVRVLVAHDAGEWRVEGIFVDH